MGSNQYWAGRVYDLCVYYMTGTPEGSTESGYRLETGSYFFGTRDLFNISYSRELYLFSKFLHFEEIVRVKMAVCFEMIVSETQTTVQLFKNM